MKILHVGPIRPTYRATGPNHSIRGLVSAQARMGLNVGLLSAFPTSPKISFEKIPGVQQLTSPHKKQHFKWTFSRDWIRRIKTEFGTPDLVHFHNVYLLFHWALARQCRKEGWPYIITPRGALNKMYVNKKRIKNYLAIMFFFRSFIKHARTINVLNRGEANEIHFLYKVNNILVAPNGVDDIITQLSDTLTPTDLGDFKKDNNLMLGFIGRIDMYSKGLDNLLQAMAILRKNTDSPGVKLFVVGPFPQPRYKDQFFSMINSHGLNDSVLYLEPKYGEDKYRCFLACDVFVHTSRHEGMPMSVLEAMALGRPCLVTPGTNIADLVCEGGGWQCRPDPVSIAETIQSFYRKKDSLATLGKQSQDIIRNRFTWDKVAQLLYQEYLKICVPA